MSALHTKVTADIASMHRPICAMLHAIAQAVWRQFWAYATGFVHWLQQFRSLKAEMISDMLASVYSCIPASHNKQAAGDTSQRTWACAEASVPCEESSAAAEKYCSSTSTV